MAVSSQQSAAELPAPHLEVLQIETFGSGGLAHYVDNLSRALAARGHQVTVLTAVDYELDEPASVSVVRRFARWSAKSRGAKPALRRSFARKVEAILDACSAALFALHRRPDVVHLHCTNPVALLHVVLLRATGRRVVATAHVVTPHEQIPFERLIYRAIHRLCHLVIAHSHFDRQRLIDEFGVAARRIVVIPHGEYGFFERHGQRLDRLAERSALGLGAHSEAAEVVLFFGYLREYKGLDLLLQAWPGVIARRPQARLVIAGDPVRLTPSRREELAAEARQLDAIARFEYVPFEEVAGYFAAADVLVMPYRRVAQSGVLYLGLSLGLPVVATRIGAWAEMLRDGENALLVPPESPAALGEAIVRALGEPALRESLAQGGRELAEEHSWPSIAGQTERAFNALKR